MLSRRADCFAEHFTAADRRHRPPEESLVLWRACARLLPVRRPATGPEGRRRFSAGLPAENGGGREDANKAKQAAPSRRTLGYGERLYTRPLKKATMKSGPAARVALNRRAYPRRPSYPAVRFANAALVLRTDRAKTTSAFCPARCPAYPHIPPRAHRCSPSGRLCKMSNIF